MNAARALLLRSAVELDQFYSEISTRYGGAHDKEEEETNEMRGLTADRGSFLIF